MKIIMPMILPMQDLPPALSLMEALIDFLGPNDELHIITPFVAEGALSTMPSRSKVHGLFEYDWYHCQRNLRFHRRLFEREVNLRRAFRGLMRDLFEEGDLVWVVHEETAAYLSKELVGFPVVLSIYELRQVFRKYRSLDSGVAAVARHALAVVVPEQHRAHIYKAWWGLTDEPFVLPNKPYAMSVLPQETPASEQAAAALQSVGERRIVLYQGALGYDRQLRAFVEAVWSMRSDYAFVVMARDDVGVRALREEAGERFIHVEGLPAPKHLTVTSWAHIGVLSYVPNPDIKRYEPLNALFAAPNKMFEYGAFGIPMLFNRVPGLLEPMERFRAGAEVDLADVGSISAGILSIESDYNVYSDGARALYESVDVGAIVSRILDHVAL